MLGVVEISEPPDSLTCLWHSSEILAQAAMMIDGKDVSWILANIFPSKETFEQLFEEEITMSSNPILAVGDLLVPEEDLDDQHSYTFDMQQLSTYARLAWALTYLVAADRQAAKDNMWTLKHSLLLHQMADDQLRTSSTQTSPFGPNVSREFLTGIVETVQLSTVYLFSDLSSSDLSHGPIVQAIETTDALPSTDALGFIVELCRSSVKLDCPKFARIIRSVLSHILRGVSSTDIDKWLTLSRKLRKTGLSIPTK